jgi:hypothetical protein
VSASVKPSATIVVPAASQILEDFDPFADETESVVSKAAAEDGRLVITTGPGSTAAHKGQRDETGNMIYDVPILTIQELIDVKFKQGKRSAAFEKLLEEKKVHKRRRRNQPSSDDDSTPSYVVREESSTAGPSTSEQPSGSNAVDVPAPAGPKLRVVNGQIVIDEESLFVSKNQITGDVPEMPVVEENSNRYVTSASFRTKKSMKTRWNNTQTKLFYQVSTFVYVWPLADMIRDCRILVQTCH